MPKGRAKRKSVTNRPKGRPKKPVDAPAPATGFRLRLIPPANRVNIPEAEQRDSGDESDDTLFGKRVVDDENNAGVIQLPSEDEEDSEDEDAGTPQLSRKRKATSNESEESSKGTSGSYI